MAKKKDEVVEEEPREPEESPDEEKELTDEELEAQEGRAYAFAMAPVVRVMREELDNDKMIRSKAKIAMNQWLEKLCRKVAQRMNESEYTVMDIDDFKTAIEPYELVEDVDEERHRIVASLEKIKMDCDSLIRDVNRKFIYQEEEEEGL